MSQMSNTSPGPIEWDLTDRLAKSLKVGGVGKREMAEHLGVARNTVTNYLSGRTTPTVSTLRVWALRCGVPFEWLRDGVDPPANPSGPDGTTSGLPVSPTKWYMDGDSEAEAA